MVISCIVLLLWNSNIQAQIAINNDNSDPDDSAILDIKSTTQGMLIPRMTTVQRQAINNPSTPATGLLVFDTDTNSFWYYNGTIWTNFNVDISSAYNTTINLNGTDLEVTDGNGTITTDLSGLQDADWLETNGSTPTSINNSIYTNGNVGIGTNNPNTSLEVNGTIIAGAGGALHNTTLNGGEGIIIPGNTADYIISTQDGNGRIQHKWNATHGTGETFVVGAEDAAFLDINANASSDNDAWIEFKHSDGSSAVAGDPISWNTQMIINQGGEVGINETKPDDMLHVTSSDNGTRIRSENLNNGWAGFLSKNTIGEIFMGIQGALDANPGEFHIYDNATASRRMVIDAGGNFGIGMDNPTVKLDVNGSVNCTGGSCSSDIRWKKDVQALQNVMSNIQKLQGVSYYWRTSDFPEKDFDTEKQIGVIAQEVEKVYPELVKTDNEGFKSMDYMSLTAVLLEGVKEQQKAIQELKAENEALKNKNQTLQTNNETIKADIEQLKAAVFGQPNKPNQSK